MNLYRVNRLNGPSMYVLASTLSKAAEDVDDVYMVELVATDKVRDDIPQLVNKI